MLRGGTKARTTAHPKTFHNHCCQVIKPKVSTSTIRFFSNDGNEGYYQKKSHDNISNENSRKKQEAKSLVQTMRKQVQQEPNAEKAWDTLWKQSVTPWDLGQPAPVIASELATRDWSRIIKNSNGNAFTITALIPGCGSGHDVVAVAQFLKNFLLSNHNNFQPGKIQIVGLELSKTSLQHAEIVIQKALKNDIVDDLSKNNDKVTTQIDLVHGDFMKVSSWKLWKSFGPIETTKSSYPITKSFHIIVDHVFFCALPPALRKEWGQQMSQLLQDTEDTIFSSASGSSSSSSSRRRRSNGQLLTIMFPYNKNNPSKKTTTNNNGQDAPGPPYPVTLQDYQQVLEPNGVTLHPDGIYQSPSTVPLRQGQEMIAWWNVASSDEIKSRL